MRIGIDYKSNFFTGIIKSYRYPILFYSLQDIRSPVISLFIEPEEIVIEFNRLFCKISLYSYKVNYILFTRKINFHKAIAGWFCTKR